MKFVLIFLLNLYSLNLFASVIVVNNDFPEKDNIENLISGYTDFNKIESRINKYLYYKGYKFSKVEDITKISGDIIISIDDGRIKECRIEGDFKISISLLKVYLKFKKGDIFNEKEFRLQIKKLYNTGLFDKIVYELYDDKYLIIIKIREKKKRFFNYSGNISSKYGVIPFVQYVDRDIFGSMTQLKISAEMGVWDNIKFQHYIAEYGIKGFNLKFSYRNGLKYMGENDYSEEMTELDFRKEFKFGKYSSMSFNLFREYHNFYEIGKFTTEYIYQGVRYGFSINYLLTYERDVVENRKVQYIDFNSINKTYGSGMFLSKLELSWKKYFSPFIYTGLVYQGDLSYIYGEKVPFDEKYAVGGFNQRGYYEGEKWSNFKFENSLEISYMVLLDRLYLSFFCDTSLIEDEQKYTFLVSNGAGILLNILKMNLYLYYGVPVDKTILNGEIYFKLEKSF